jgi:hypothetical protein
MAKGRLRRRMRVSDSECSGLQSSMQCATTWPRPADPSPAQGRRWRSDGCARQCGRDTARHLAVAQWACDRCDNLGPRTDHLPGRRVVPHVSARRSIGVPRSPTLNREVVDGWVVETDDVVVFQGLVERLLHTDVGSTLIDSPPACASTPRSGVARVRPGGRRGRRGRSIGGIADGPRRHGPAIELAMDRVLTPPT